MGVFPDTTGYAVGFAPFVVGPGTVNGGVTESLSFSSNTITTDSTLGTGQAQYRQFTIDTATYLNSVAWLSGTHGSTANCTLEIAIYSEVGTRLATTGTITMTVGTLTAIQTASFGAAVTLTTGCYYMAWHNKNSPVPAGGATQVPFRTSAAYTINKHRAMGTFEQYLGNVALPATATFAAVTSSTGTVGSPCIMLMGRA
jgi:hypothetical protein